MASKRAIRRKSCEGKQKHKTYQDAKYHLRHLVKISGGSLGVYNCKFCGSYHVGHMSNKLKIARQMYICDRLEKKH
jgi:hypothetical protein